MNIIKDKTLLLLSSIGAVAFLLFALVEHKPNRISHGMKYSSFEFLGILGSVILLLWIILMFLALYENKHKNIMVFVLASLLVISLFWILQLRTGVYIGDSTSERISLSSGFYVQIFSIYMIFSTYTKRINEFKFIKVAGAVVIFGMLAYFMMTGAFDDLSLIKEYYIKETQFYDNLRIHGVLTLASVITGSIIAIPLGFIAYSKNKFENVIMVPLSIIETIPSLSLFGVLLIPLSGLGKLPFFDAIGVSGIGWAPAFVALTLYTLLPIGRNTLTGFYSVDKNVIEAAEGMGMSKRQVLKRIEFPLAFPIIFAGIKIAFIQTIGGAVLAGLVGGGGMGTFVFLGLGEASPDLILLGVLPIVFFTVILNYILNAFENFMRGCCV